jgi:hypothetical protein
MAAPIGDHFVRVHALVRFLAEELLHDSCTFGMRVMPPTRTTSLISEAERPASFSAFPAGLDGALHEVVDQRFELRAGQLDR